MSGSQIHQTPPLKDAARLGYVNDQGLRSRTPSDICTIYPETTQIQVPEYEEEVCRIQTRNNHVDTFLPASSENSTRDANANSDPALGDERPSIQYAKLLLCLLSVTVTTISDYTWTMCGYWHLTASMESLGPATIHGLLLTLPAFIEHGNECTKLPWTTSELCPGCSSGRSMRSRHKSSRGPSITMEK